MSIKQALCYWAVCDRCGTESTEWGEVTAFRDIDGAEAEASNLDWDATRGNHLCWDCTPMQPDEEDEQ
jgi:hypothetical protein